jgi:hypothetical protein
MTYGLNNPRLAYKVTSATQRQSCRRLLMADLRRETKDSEVGQCVRGLNGRCLARAPSEYHVCRTCIQIASEVPAIQGRVCCTELGSVHVTRRRAARRRLYMIWTRMEDRDTTFTESMNSWLPSHLGLVTTRSHRTSVEDMQNMASHSSPHVAQYAPPLLIVQATPPSVRCYYYARGNSDDPPISWDRHNFPSFGRGSFNPVSHSSDYRPTTHHDIPSHGCQDIPSFTEERLTLAPGASHGRGALIKCSSA